MRAGIQSPDVLYMYDIRQMSDRVHKKTRYMFINIFTKMFKDVGIEAPKSIETRSKFSMHAEKGRG